MRKFTIVAALAFAAALPSVAARADFNYGPTKEGKLCWKTSLGGSNGVNFGYWETCPAPASARVRKH